MMRISILFIAMFLTPLANAQTFGPAYVDNLWGGDNTNGALSRTWSDPSGRDNFQTQVSGASTAMALWGSAGTLPTSDSRAEITLHRFAGGVPDERINISAMATADGAAYRFGVERDAGAQFRDIIFCFENVTPGASFCPMKITTAGVFIKDGAAWYPVAHQ